MNTWNEGNFLEVLTPELRRKLHAEANSCPDMESLIGVLEGQPSHSANRNETIARHLAECHDCTDLYSRLFNFQLANPSDPGIVWKESRKRLDNWMEGFLRAQAALPPPTPPVEIHAPRETTSKFWFPWKLQWALAGAFALLLVLGGVILERAWRGQVRENQTATREPSASTSPKTVASGGPSVRPTSPPGTRQAPLEAKGPEVKNAQGVQPPVSAPTPSAAPSPAVQSADNRPVAPSAPTPTPSGQPPGQPANAASGPLGTNSPVPRPPDSAPAAPRPFIRLDSGTHLVAVVDSVRWLTRETFQFHGTLLVGIVQSGSVQLDQGAEVAGAGEISQGQTSITIKEFVVQGTHFTVKSGSGAMKAQTPGAGGAVQFDKSQVLEMWPVSPVIYAERPHL